MGTFNLSDEPPKKDEILELIHLIENNKHRVFRPWDRFVAGGALFRYVVPFFCLGLFMFLLVEAPEYFSEIGNAVNLVALTIALFALNNSVIAHVESSEKERLINCRYGKMKKLVDGDKKPLLKALIKMKQQNTEFSLEQAYKLNPDLFTQKNLIAVLYA